MLRSVTREQVAHLHSPIGLLTTKYKNLATQVKGYHLRYIKFRNFEANGSIYLSDDACNASIGGNTFQALRLRFNSLEK